MEKTSCVFMLITISVVIIIFGSIRGNGNFVNPVELCRKYFSIFSCEDDNTLRKSGERSKKRFVWNQFLIYCVAPVLLGIALGMEKTLNLNLTGTFLVVLSLIATSLFSVYGILIALQDCIMQREEKNASPSSNSTIQNIAIDNCKLRSKQLVCIVINQTFDILNYEILLTVILVALCLIATISGSEVASKEPVLRMIGSMAIYSLMFALFFNLLIVLKRISRLVAELSNNNRS